MKKSVFMVGLFFLALVSFSCSKKNDGSQAKKIELTQNKSVDVKKVQSENNSSSAEKIDVDLTKLSATVVYAEVFNMMVEPEKYVGKTVRMKGMFYVYENDEYDSNFSRIYACIITDATACCAEGIEFRLEDKLSYPEDFPKLYSTIIVTGTFFAEEVDGITRTGLMNAYFE